MDKEVMLALMKVLMSLKTLSGDSIVGICGKLQTNKQAEILVNKIKLNPKMTESELIKETLNISNQYDVIDMRYENYLRNLGFTWITIAEAMADDKKEKTISLLKNNPKITKEEFLELMNIEEVIY
ncbi:MAG: hypothetical protein IKJ33_03225 [Clostridia bacterium]|nr:hypothetical protein [Clostridia bacterium]